MGKTMNKVFIVGYAGSDAEQRTTQGGVKYARVSLSTSYGGYQQGAQQFPPNVNEDGLPF